MKWRSSVLACSLIASAFFAYGQNSVGIGVANPNRNAVLELISPNNNQGLLIPKLTTAQRTATAFTSALSDKENGLMVFDSQEKKFYYWETNAWKAIGTGNELLGGDGVNIVNNTISTIPQDIEVVGSTLTITNNPTAVPIDLSSLNIPQDLELNGSTLTITNNPDATPINLSAFTGTNTDDQTLTFDGATGDLTISRVTDGPLTVNIPIPTTTPPSGAAGGDLSGNYPNPAVAGNAINSAKIADGTVASVDITDGTIASVDIADGTVTSADILDATIVSADITDGTVASVDITDGTVASVDITDNTIASADINDGTVASIDITDNTIVSADINDGTVASIDITNNTIVSADINDGTIASVDIADATIVSADINDGTIASVDIADATILSADINDGTIASVDIADGTIVSADISDGTVASVDIADNTIVSADISDGTVSTADIADLTIADGDINATANIAVTKLAGGGSGQVLTTSGTTVGWANPSGSVLLNNAGVRNLFAGFDVGAPAGGTDNAFYGFQAGNPATTGDWNVVIGSGAGRNNADGDQNTLIGWAAGSASGLTLFNGNTFVGARAGQNSTSGPSTFIGEQAGQGNTTGTLNVFVGNSAGIANTIGAQNTILGYSANVSTGGLNNATAIGFGAIVDANNKVRIGNGSVAVIEGAVGFTNASDRRLKTNIRPIENGLDLIMKMKPMSYRMRNSSDTRTNWGFIAQDVEELVGPDNAIVTTSGDRDKTLGLRYSDLIAPLVKAVQEQQDQISDLNSKLDESTKKVDLLIAELENLKKAVGLKAENK